MIKTKSPSDKKWGYRFGCDGSADFKEAGDLLGIRAKNTMRKMAEEGHIRIGKHKGGPCAKVVFCRRSINEYLASLEN